MWEEAGVFEEREKKRVFWVNFLVISSFIVFIKRDWKIEGRVRVIIINIKWF